MTTSGRKSQGKKLGQGQQSKRKRRKVNPIYVVTQRGNTVETAETFMTALITRLGIRPVVEMVLTLMEELLAGTRSYGVLKYLTETLDQFLTWVYDRLRPGGLAAGH